MDAVETVVGGHDRHGIGVGHHHTEGLEVKLPQGALGDVGGGRASGRLLVVGGVVLDARPRSRGLHTAHVSRRHESGEDGILGAILKVTAAKHVLLNVHAGAQHDINAQSQRILADGLSHACDQRGIPGGGEVVHRGIPYGGIVPHARGAVVDGDGRNSQTFDGIGTARGSLLHGILHTRDHVGLFLKGHGRHHAEHTVGGELGQTVLQRQGDLIRNHPLGGGTNTGEGQIPLQLVGRAIHGQGLFPLRDRHGLFGNDTAFIRQRVGDGSLHARLCLYGKGQGHRAALGREGQGKEGQGSLNLGLGLGLRIGLAFGGIGGRPGCIDGGIRGLGWCLGNRVGGLHGGGIGGASRHRQQDRQQDRHQREEFFHGVISF